MPSTKEPWRFVGKSMLVEAGGERLLVLSDLHLGYDESLRQSGVHVPSTVFSQTKVDLDALLAHVGKVTRVILLGDIKHAFGVILRDERNELEEIIDLFYRYAREIVLIRGNHDVTLDSLLVRYNLKVLDFYIVGEFCFFHGDKDFKELYDRSVSTWVLGHVHPAFSLHEGSKTEKYKCFLVGRFKDKRVVILPSFFPASEGSDVGSRDLGIIWPFDVDRFGVYIVGPDFEALHFGNVGQHAR